MIQINTDEDSNIIYTISSGKLDNEDYQKLIPVAEAKIAKYGKVRWYFEMDHFQGWHLDTLWRDLKFDFKHVRDFEKVAMVGDKKWQEWMSKSLQAVIFAELKYFNRSEKQLAERWIRE